MTNYSQYPSWRDYYGIIIKFSDHQYSWSENNKAQRKYLLESPYCDGAEAIYVCADKKWFTLIEFKNYLKNYVFVKR
jgi:hypothetical protein